ncbi:MAG: hypothetical protein ACYTG0_03095 [Planctomycetota bacterium]|jgi:hypothetical protein
MNVGLNPTTVKKLEQFGRRRRRLIVTRGVCAAAVSFLLLMSAVALADWLWVLSDQVRWTLSGLGYAGAALVVWLTCLRLMLRIPSKQDLARRVELAEPELRENLLSAVELGSDDEGRLHDSPVFRRLLQDRVGRQMAGVRVPALLPLRLLSGWLVAALLILAAFGVLLSVPGLPFGVLMTRAMLPGANVDRVSRIRVTILEPVPHSLTLPQNETVAVLVEISGGEVDEATLETHAETGGVTRHPMRARGASQFVSNLSIEAESIDYRILAGDAVTRKYTILARPRPGVRAFHKTYRFAEYTGLEDEKVTEPHGDLVALEGTEAELVLELDQDVSQAELRVERSGSDEIETVALEPHGDRRLRATLSMTDPAVYRVHLVARETDFENTFSPKYEIRPEPDLIPRVGFVDQQETTLLLPPNDILALEGLAEDDLPLVGLAQHVSVNGRQWQEIPLEIQQRRRVRTAWDWDLLDLNLESGDQVITKLVATDRKGNDGESVPLVIVVSAPDFDPKRHAVMELKAELYDELADFANSVERHQASAMEMLERLREQAQQKELQDADFSNLLDLAEKVREEADRIFKHVVEALPRMPAGTDAHELELAARVVARIRYDHMQVPNVYRHATGRARDVEKAEEDLDRVKKAFHQSAEDARRLEDRYRDLMTHNVLAALALDLDALLQHQRQLVTQGAPLSWRRLLRQETVAISQIRALERLIRDNMPRLRESTRRGLLRYVDWARTSRERLEAATESEDQLETLRRTAVSLTTDLEGRQKVGTLESRLHTSIVEARKGLDQRAGSLFVPLERLAQSATEVGRLAGLAAESDDSTESRQFLSEAERAAAELRAWHVPGTTRLKSQRSVTQARRDSDSQYAADAGLTRRAVLGLLRRYEEEPPDESEVPASLAEIAPAYRVLESGHEVVQIRACLANLLSLERWDSQEITARLDHPRQWDAVQTSFEIAARKLREARYPSEIASQVDRLRSSEPAQDAARRITGRRYRRDAPITAVHDLVELRAELDASWDEIEPIMAEARALIAKYAPTVPEMARRAAEDLRDLEHQTTDVADHVSNASEEDTQPEIDALQDEQQQINQQIDDLTDALVEDANAQDLLTEEGRQRARDADDSVAMVREPANRMNQAMQQAAAAERPPDQARDLSQAAEHQEQTADALDQVAEHFERLESGQDVAETRNALRQAERELGIARQMNQQYRRAEELGEMAAKSPQQLMAELEAKLQKNPAMQDALSEISRDALQQAKNSLENSADEEQAMRRSIERSDREFQAEKKRLVEALRQIAQEASDLERTLVAQADSAANAGRAEETRERLRQTRRDLGEAATKPRNVSESNVLDDVVEAARGMADALENASENVDESVKLAAAAKDEAPDDNEQQLAARRRDLETAQKRFHDQRIREAKERAQRRAQVERQASQRVKSAESSLRNADRQLSQARQNRQRNPESDSAQRSLDQANARRQDAQNAVDAAKEGLAEAKHQTEQAGAAVKALTESKLEPLTAANPGAELAHRFSEEAADIAEDLAQRARELAGEPSWSDDLSPNEGVLTQATSQQEDVGEDVSQAGEDVARAGRHEQRLGKPEISDQLGRAAGDIEEVAQGEVATAENKLADAAARASSVEQDGAGGNPQAPAATASVGEAEEAITEQAEALGEILNPSAQSASAQTQAQAAALPSPGEAAEGQLLARTLDDLDRTMAASQAGSGMPQPGPSSLAQAAQAQMASMAQGRMQNGLPGQNAPALEGALQSADGTALTGLSPDFSVTVVNRSEDEDWGQLRDQSAEDLTEGRREAVSAEYRKRVETYFRVIAERARKKE